MDRREVLKAALGVTTVSTIGLAGCGGGGPCGAPSDSLEGALPEADDFTVTEEPSSLSGGSEVEEAVYAFYEGQYGKAYGVGIVEFSSADATEDGSQEVKETVTEEGSVVARLSSGKYLYYATGPTENSITTLLESSSALDTSCVDSNIEFV